MKSVGLSDYPCGTPWLILMFGCGVFYLEVCVPVGKEAADEPLENVWDVVLVHGVELAVVPDFVKGLFHIHEYGCTGLYFVFCQCHYLCQLEQFVVCAFFCFESSLFIVYYIVCF